MNKLAKLFLFFFAIVLSIIFTYLIYPKKVYVLNGTLNKRDNDKGEWTTLMDVPACSDERKGPWCYIECYDKSNYKYYLCKAVTTRYKQNIEGYGDIVVACPSMENTNLLNEICEPIAIT